MTTGRVEFDDPFRYFHCQRMNPSHDTPHLLEVRSLSVSVSSGEGTRELLHQISFILRRHEALTLLGESGSGKTILGRSITRLFPATHPMIVEGSIVFEGRRVLTFDEDGLARLRRTGIRYVFQEPVQSLNPLATVRAQLRMANDSSSGGDATLKNALRNVDLDADRVLGLFPHQLSVGMAQRVCIAMALLPSPSLLVADEPTSALDAPLRRTLIDLITSIHRGGTMSLFMITHDLDVARAYGDRVVVLYGGRIIESASREAFFAKQLHPYSQVLVDAQPRAGKVIAVPASASSITAGTIPDRGCRFHAHCPKVEQRCRESEPELERTADEREVRCFYWK